ncbi:DUF1794 domain-containing protein [Flavobacterium sp. ZT3R18]|nr:DUF1794 domain-containing protein [Flavobacterium sp. ZT3R18]
MEFRKILKSLLGEWTGNGSGKSPTIAPFDYKEILTFSFDGFNDLIHYEQKTWLNHNNNPSH